jgi:hypothetical protein
MLKIPQVLQVPQLMFQINVLLMLLSLLVLPVDDAVKRLQKAPYVSTDQLFFYIYISCEI